MNINNPLIVTSRKCFYLMLTIAMFGCSDPGADLEFQVQAYQEQILPSTVKEFVEIQSLNDQTIEIEELSLNRGNCMWSHYGRDDHPDALEYGDSVKYEYSDTQCTLQEVEITTANNGTVTYNF